MVRLLILGIIFISASANSSELDNISLSISITKENDIPQWKVSYIFSESVSALDFNNVPYSFLSESWRFETDDAEMDYSSLVLASSVEKKNFDIVINGANDDFILRYYTPFLNFSDGSHALYLLYYIPHRIQAGGQWINTNDIQIDINLTASEYDNILFSGLNATGNLRIDGNDFQKYAFIGGLEVNIFDDFNIIVDDGLPEEIRDSYLKAIPELFHYYENKTHASLEFKPLFLINFNPVNAQPRSDGGAINQQVVINLVGKGWADRPQDNIQNLLFLLAHEMAHLWNSQHWKKDQLTPIWLSEGGADYFARNALHDLDYITDGEYTARFASQLGRCDEAIQISPINNFEAQRPSLSPSAYPCGDVLYSLASSMLDTEDSFEIWNKMTAETEGLYYSESDYINVLRKSNTIESDLSLIQNILNVNKADNNDDLNRLIRKYLTESLL